MREIVVDVQHVSKSFGSEQVLEDVTLQMMRGKIHGIIGRNGSGKTVLMKCICGFLRPTAGKISVFGKNIGTDCDFAPKTGMLIETPGFLPHETGMSNLLWLAKLGNGARCEDVAALMRLVGLDPAAKKRVSQYSLGMRQRLGIAQALLDAPELLILDEPMNGLDKNGVAEIRALLLDPENKAMDETTEAILYAAARAQHVRQVIRPALQAGKTVLCDRFVDSSVAYQGGGRQLGVDTVLNINRPAVDGTMPMLTVYLDIDREAALRRRAASSQLDRIEQADDAFRTRTEAAYHELIRREPERFIVVDAAKPAEEVSKEMTEKVIRRLMEAEA